MADNVNVVFFSLTIVLIFRSSMSNLPLPDHRLLPPYQGQGSDRVLGPSWDLLNSNVFDDYVLLTPDLPYRHGAVWNTFSLSKAYWEFQIVFKIDGQHPTGGNGMAFWYVTDPGMHGPVFGNKNFFKGLGVFIDISIDAQRPHHHAHPYVSAMVNNGTVSYYHDTHGTSMELGNCSPLLRNFDEPSRIAIAYKDDVLNVFISSKKSDPWSLCFSSTDVFLPTGGFVGITADTGAVSSSFKVMSLVGFDFTDPKQGPLNRNALVPRAENYKRFTPIVDVKTDNEITEDVPEAVKAQEPRPAEEDTEKPSLQQPEVDSKLPEVEKEDVDDKVSEDKDEVKVETEEASDTVEDEGTKKTKTMSLKSKLALITLVVFVAIFAFRVIKKYLADKQAARAKRMY